MVLAGQLDPEDLRELVRAYQTTCSELIRRFDGHIAQLLGDGLLVYFGYPQAHEDDARRAVHAGLGIVEAIEKLNTLSAEPVATGYDPLVDAEPELARTLSASVQQRIAFGERAGQKVRRIGSGFGYEGESPTLTGTRCASVHGFSLHANTHIPAHRQDQLERLIRYTARGSVSPERLGQDESGDLIYTFS